MDAMDDLDQTEAELTTLRARKLANVKNADTSVSRDDDSISEEDRKTKSRCYQYLKRIKAPVKKVSVLYRTLPFYQL